MVTAGELLRSAVTGQRRTLLPAIAGTVVHQACESGVPIVIGVVVDRVIARGSGTGLLVSMAGLAVLFAVLSSSMRLSARLVRRSTQNAAHDLRLRIADRVLDPRGMAGGQAVPGALLSTATSDAGRVGMVNAAVWGVAGAVAALAVSAIALLRASTVLGLVVLIGLVPVYLLTRFASGPLQRRSGIEQAAAAKATGLATDFVTGLRVLKGLGAEAAAAARYRDASRHSSAAAVRAATVLAGRTGLITVLTGLFLAVVALVGGRLAADGTISVGEFVTAIGLTQFLIGPFTRLAMAGAMWARGRASAKRIADVLGADVAVPGGSVPMPEPAVGEIELRALRSGPLRDLTTTVKAGECVGVVAADPAVAGALLRCLALQELPEAGAILVDGVSLAEADLSSARGVVLVADHDAALFAGPVADTVVGSVADALRAADADQVVATLPAGLATVLGERGRTLSGGQQQRIVLARALAADPPALVLHEPTTAVDAATEARIAAGIRTMRTDRTTILVTTSPALLSVTDRVLLLAGEVTTTGTHDELLADETYREAVLG